MNGVKTGQTYQTGIRSAFLARQELSACVSISPAAKLIEREIIMTLGTILLIVLILILIGVVPTWPHSSGWGYGPSGLVGTVLVILLILVLLGKL